MDIKNFEEIDISTNDHVISFMAEYFFVGNGGDIALEDDYGNQATFKNIEDGTWLMVSAKKVLKANTTASNIVAISSRGMPK